MQQSSVSRVCVQVYVYHINTMRREHCIGNASSVSTNFSGATNASNDTAAYECVYIDPTTVQSLSRLVFFFSSFFGFCFISTRKINTQLFQVQLPQVIKRAILTTAAQVTRRGVTATLTVRRTRVGCTLLLIDKINSRISTCFFFFKYN